MYENLDLRVFLAKQKRQVFSECLELFRSCAGRSLRNFGNAEVMTIYKHGLGLLRELDVTIVSLDEQIFANSKTKMINFRSQENIQILETSTHYKLALVEEKIQEIELFSQKLS